MGELFFDLEEFENIAPGDRDGSERGAEKACGEVECSVEGKGSCEAEEAGAVEREEEKESDKQAEEAEEELFEDEQGPCALFGGSEDAEDGGLACGLEDNEGGQEAANKDGGNSGDGVEGFD